MTLSKPHNDRTFLWRATMLVLQGLGVVTPIVLVFAAQSWVRKEAAEVINTALAPFADVPARLTAVEKIANERGSKLKDYDAIITVFSNNDARFAAQLAAQDVRFTRMEQQLDEISRFIRDRK